MTVKFRDRLLPHLLARASYDIGRDQLAEVRNHGFTVRQWRLLGCLWDEESLTQTELSQVIFCSQSTTTRLVEKLTGLGLLKKSADATDRRKSHISLTDKGREIARHLVDLAEASEQKSIEVLGADRAEQIRAHLSEIIRLFGDHNQVD